MALLTKYHSNDRITIDLVNNLYSAAEGSRNNGKKRNYLGMSEIGRPCNRELWLNFRGFPRIPIEGRIIMLFEFGDLIEDRVIYWLREAGYSVTDQQLSFSSHNDWFKGHCDGTISGVTKKDHILEIKSANKNKFESFKRFGVRKTYPVYYSQVQCYMGYSSLERALVIVQCKDTSEIYGERIYFNNTDFQALHRRALDIISANTIPPRPFDPNSFECKYCNQRIVCYHPEGVPMETKCNYCCFYGFWGLKQYCWHPKHPYRLKSFDGCPDWTDMFEKTLPGQKPDYEKVKPYELREFYAEPRT